MRLIGNIQKDIKRTKKELKRLDKKLELLLEEKQQVIKGIANE